MAELVIAEKEEITAVADAIRSVSGTTDAMTLSEMAESVLDTGTKITAPATAEVGQYLIVKAVDENGKPTEWEAVDRTHYSEQKTIFPETTVAFEQSVGVLDGVVLALGSSYALTFDGVTYECVASEVDVDGESCIGIGNTGLLLGEEGEPVLVIYNPIAGATGIFAVGYTEAVVKIVGETIVKIPAKYLHTHDLSQNDPTAVDYVKGRTHYEEAVEVLPEQALTYDDNDGIFLFPDDFSLTVGNTYMVKWNGKTYKCVCFDLDGAPSMGNGVEWGLEDTGEPFAISYAFGAYGAFDIGGATEVTAAISMEHIVKIPSKYLHTPDLSQNDPTAPDYVKGRTHWSEIVENAVILPEKTVSTINYTAMWLGRMYIKMGDTVTVIFDGVEYVCEAYKTALSGIPVVALGNGALAGGTGGNNEPFLLCDALDAHMTALVAVDGAHSVKVTGARKVYHPLERDYVADALEIVTDGTNVTCTWEELLIALKENKRLFVSERSRVSSGGGTYKIARYDFRKALYNDEYAEIKFISFETDTGFANRYTVLTIDYQEGVFSVSTNTFQMTTTSVS